MNKTIIMFIYLFLITYFVISYQEVAHAASGGTAFSISNNGLFITNKHVIAETVDQGRNEVNILIDGIYSVGKVIKISSDSDLALIKVEGVRLKNCLDISSRENKVNDKIKIVLFDKFKVPDNFKTKTIIYGHILTPYPKSLASDIHITAIGRSGNSGSPILNYKNDVVGVYLGHFSKHENISMTLDQVIYVRGIAVNSTHLNKFISESQLIVKCSDSSDTPLDSIFYVVAS